MRVAHLQEGDWVLLPGLEHWGWIEVVDAGNSTGTGYACLLDLRVLCGTTQRQVSVTTWRKGWELVTRIPRGTASGVPAGGPPARPRRSWLAAKRPPRRRPHIATAPGDDAPGS